MCAGAGPGEKAYATLSRGGELHDAEDFRFHAIRGKAYDTFSRTHSGVYRISHFFCVCAGFTHARVHMYMIILVCGVGLLCVCVCVCVYVYDGPLTRSLGPCRHGWMDG